MTTPLWYLINFARTKQEDVSRRFTRKLGRGLFGDTVIMNDASLTLKVGANSGRYALCHANSSLLSPCIARLSLTLNSRSSQLQAARARRGGDGQAVSFPTVHPEVLTGLGSITSLSEYANR